MTLGLRRIGGLLRGEGARQGYVGMVDQALVSGTNFVTQIVLSRELAPEAYGAYNIALGGLLFAGGLQVALVTGPLSVIGAKLSGPEFGPYLRANATAQLALAAGFAVLAGLAALAVPGLDAAAGGGLAPALAAAVLAWQLQEFARRAYYARGQTVAVLQNDLVSYGVLLLGVAGLAVGGGLAVARVFWLVALASGCAAVLALWRLRSELARSMPVGEAMRRNWGMGRWLLAGSLTQWSSEHLYPFLTGGLLGLAASGAFRALQNICALSYVIAQAVETVFTPRAAAAYAAGGDAALVRLVRRLGSVTVPLVFGFLGLVAVFAEPLLALFYAGTYAGYGAMLAVYTLAFGLGFLRSLANIALRAKELTRPIFESFVAATIATLTLGLWLVRAYGLWGAVVGSIVNAAVLAGFLWWSWRRSVKAAAP